MKRYNYTFDGYHMRLLRTSDFDMYYKCGFIDVDPEAYYYTGSTGTYTKNQIKAYVEKIVDDPTRYDFIVLEGDEIVGEVVLNEIQARACHYRICIFKKENFSKGIGYKATKEIIRFAFEEIGLESIVLEVFHFNKRAIGLYKKLGFTIVGEFFDEDAEVEFQKGHTMRLIQS